jgi:uncharacterized protein
MFGLQRIFGKTEAFFTLLEQSAEESRHSIQSIIRIISHPEQIPTLDDLAQTRRKEKQITEQIRDLLTRTWFLGLDREDIEDLSQILYRIPKMAEKFAERFILSQDVVRHIDFSRHIDLLDRCSEAVITMVKDLRSNRNLQEVKQKNDRLQYFEGEADKLMLALYRDLYSGNHEAVLIFVLKDLFEMLEACIDSCRDGGNVIYRIVLKNS